MGKTGNKARRQRRYAREPASTQEEIEMSYPSLTKEDEPYLMSAEDTELAKMLKGEPVLTSPEEAKKFTSEKKEAAAVAVVKEAKEEVKKARHRVTVLADHLLEFPELYAGVYVSGPTFDQRGFPELLMRAKCYKADTPQEADFVIFTGGADVDPLLYGCRNPHSSVHCVKSRDDDDMQLYLQCLDEGVPMLGVCRGAQFLHVMNGGKLFNDVDGHNGDHHMWDRDEKILIDRVSSVHHQMVISNPLHGMHVIATSGGSSERWLNAEDKEVGIGVDIEAFFYRDTACLGIQGHPEYAGYNYFAYWTMNKINNFFFQSPDTTFINGKLRMKPELLAQRNAGFGVAEPLTVETVTPEENV